MRVGNANVWPRLTLVRAPVRRVSIVGSTRRRSPHRDVTSRERDTAMTSQDRVIEVRRVAKASGDVNAFDGLDLSVEDASIVGLLGLNGAGKTTLAQILAGLLTPGCGSARVGGHDVVAEPEAVGTLIGFAGQSGSPASRPPSTAVFTGRLSDAARLVRTSRSDVDMSHWRHR